MRAFYQMKPFADINGNRLVELTFRTESSVIVSWDKFHDLAEVAPEDNFKDMLLLLKEMLDAEYTIPTKFLGRLSGDWNELEPDLNGHRITYRMLERIAELFSAEANVRIEGSCPATFLVLGTGDAELRIQVDDRSLPLIRDEMEEIIRQNPPLTYNTVNREATAKVNAAAVAGLVLAAVGVGIEAWRLYREEQDRARDKAERERARQERMHRERECREIRGDTSAGGPAAGEVLDRISRTA